MHGETLIIAAFKYRIPKYFPLIACFITVIYLLFALPVLTWALNLTVGPSASDIIGTDSVTVQIAIDRVSRGGGGTVFIRPGTYLMVAALQMKSNVNVVGMGAAPVLEKVPSQTFLLGEDAGHGATQIRVVDSVGLVKGMSIAILDDKNADGWYVATRIIAEITGNIITLDEPLEIEYLIDRNARIETVSPVISFKNVKNSRLENLITDGNRYDCSCLGGARGAAIYIWRSEKILVDNCIARNFNGDGISVQVSNDVTLRHCQALRNAGTGVLLSSGSTNITMNGCEVRDNAQNGLCLEWKITASRITDNTIETNTNDGISLQHQSVDNILMGNTISRNGRHGIYFTRERAVHGAHRNILQDNVIRDNGQILPGDGINIQGQTFDITIIGNTVEDTPRDGRVTQQMGLYLGPGVDGVKANSNIFRGQAVEMILDESGGQRNNLQ